MAVDLRLRTYNPTPRQRREKRRLARRKTFLQMALSLLWVATVLGLDGLINHSPLHRLAEQAAQGVLGVPVQGERLSLVWRPDPQLVLTDVRWATHPVLQADALRVGVHWPGLLSGQRWLVLDLQGLHLDAAALGLLVHTSPADAARQWPVREVRARQTQWRAADGSLTVLDAAWQWRGQGRLPHAMSLSVSHGRLAGLSARWGPAFPGIQRLQVKLDQARRPGGWLSGPLLLSEVGDALWLDGRLQGEGFELGPLFGAEPAVQGELALSAELHGRGDRAHALLRALAVQARFDLAWPVLQGVDLRAATSRIGEARGGMMAGERASGVLSWQGGRAELALDEFVSGMLRTRGELAWTPRDGLGGWLLVVPGGGRIEIPVDLLGTLAEPRLLLRPEVLEAPLIDGVLTPGAVVPGPGQNLDAPARLRP